MTSQNRFEFDTITNDNQMTWHNDNLWQIPSHNHKWQPNDNQIDTITNDNQMTITNDNQMTITNDNQMTTKWQSQMTTKWPCRWHVECEKSGWPATCKPTTPTTPKCVTNTPHARIATPSKQNNWKCTKHHENVTNANKNQRKQTQTCALPRNMRNSLSLSLLLSLFLSLSLSLSLSFSLSLDGNCRGMCLPSALKSGKPTSRTFVALTESPCLQRMSVYPCLAARCSGLSLHTSTGSISTKRSRSAWTCSAEPACASLCKGVMPQESACYPWSTGEGPEPQDSGTNTVGLFVCNHLENSLMQTNKVRATGVKTDFTNNSTTVHHVWTLSPTLNLRNGCVAFNKTCWSNKDWPFELNDVEWIDVLNNWQLVNQTLQMQHIMTNWTVVLAWVCMLFLMYRLTLSIAHATSTTWPQQ